jgi:hypothetical protein
VAPPDPIPNSEVKRNRADGSLGSPHARVGHFQAPNKLEVVASFADMAQLVERILGKDEVPSSILGISTKNNLV